jgi:hypothetical protein
MNTSSARSRSAGIRVFSAMVYPGTRHGRENGDVVAVNISTGATEWAVAPKCGISTPV